MENISSPELQSLIQQAEPLSKSLLKYQQFQNTPQVKISSYQNENNSKDLIIPQIIQIIAQLNENLKNLALNMKNNNNEDDSIFSEIQEDIQNYSDQQLMFSPYYKNKTPITLNDNQIVEFILDFRIPDKLLIVEEQNSNNQIFIQSLGLELNILQSNIEKLVNVSGVNKDDKKALKNYECPFCEQTFAKGQQLGGHLSKKHKGMSIRYQKSIKKRNYRTQERRRNRYFKNFIQK